MIICVRETHSWSFQASEVTGLLFVLLDKVKSFDMAKEKFWYVKRKVLICQKKKQQKDKYVNVNTCLHLNPLDWNHARTTPETSITHMIWFLIMECCSLLTHYNMFFWYFGGGSYANTNLLNKIMCRLSFLCPATKSGGVLCYTLRAFECLSVRTSVSGWTFVSGP